MSLRNKKTGDQIHQLGRPTSISDPPQITTAIGVSLQPRRAKTKCSQGKAFRLIAPFRFYKNGGGTKSSAIGGSIGQDSTGGRRAIPTPAFAEMNISKWSASGGAATIFSPERRRTRHNPGGTSKTTVARQKGHDQKRKMGGAKIKRAQGGKTVGLIYS